MIFVVVDLQLAAQHVRGPGGAGFQVIAEMVMLAVAGPVFDHTGLTVEGFPAVMTAQAQRIAVAGHHAFGVAETAHRVAVAVNHFDQLAVIVVAVLD